MGSLHFVWYSIVIWNIHVILFVFVQRVLHGYFIFNQPTLLKMTNFAEVVKTIY
jgi:hypothetical protein